MPNFQGACATALLALLAAGCSTPRKGVGGGDAAPDASRDAVMDGAGGDGGGGRAADGAAGNEGGSIPEAGGAGMDMMGSMPGGPPSLNGCREYLHYARAPQCDDARNVDDWGVRSVAFSPDGQLLAAAAEDAVINLWTVAGSQLTGPRAIPSASFEAVAFSNDGALLASAGTSGRLNVYGVADGQKRYGAGGFEDTLYFTGFSADNDRFFTTTVRAGKVDVWSVSRMSKSSDYTAVSPLRAVAVPRPAAGPWILLAAGVDGQARFVDLDAPLAPASPPFAIAMADDDYKVVLGQDGKRLAVANQEGVFLWDVSDHTMPRRAPVALRTWSSLEDAWALAFSPSGQHLAVAVVGTTGASVAIYGAEPQRLLAEKTLRIRPISLAFSPDGRGLAVGLVACGVLVYCRD
jgi:WD40 repeat protein